MKVPVLNEGTRLAERYTLVRRLGSGGMSEVWLARDARSRSNVALKFLAPALAATAGYRELFRTEWQTGIRLMHAHIARVFEYHDDPDGPFYSQQFIGGPDASTLAGRPITEALKPFGLIADALRYAHGKGLVHRDIKAGNVLFDGRGSPYLVDFGIAAQKGAAASGGTPAAAPPRAEGAEHAEAAQPADDVYALGVLMHEVLFGEPPGAGADGLAGRRTLTGESLPAALADLLAAMLARDERNRPEAEAVALALREAGIEPGAITLSAAEVDSAGAEDEVVEAVHSAQAWRRSAPATSAAAPEGERRGVSTAFLYGGLVLLAVVVVAVFWLLPRVLESDRSGTPDTVPDRPAAEEAAGESGAGEAEAPAPRERSPAELQAIKAATDETLGELLSVLERLELRAIERWGGQAFQEAKAVYEQGDAAYIEGDYELAGQRYREALERLRPFFGRIDAEFARAMQAGKAAFGHGNHADAVRQFDLAVAITPNSTDAKQWLDRARNLEAVLRLTDQGLRFENELALDAARSTFERALELDPGWQPASEGLQRVVEAIRQRSFEQRMTEGFAALTAGNYPTARAAFEAAKDLKPGSQEPVDGLLQVEQEVRLARIRRLEQEAKTLEENEQWQAAVATYQEILEIDSLLRFAREGLARSRQKAALFAQLEQWIGQPDALAVPATMQAATNVLLDISRMPSVGPRLEDRKNELARLLKRAATPLTVKLISDNATQVSIFRVGQLGTFTSRTLELRPGHYVAVGSRPGYRDVRLEFQVAPELELEPIVIKCEERI